MTEYDSEDVDIPGIVSDPTPSYEYDGVHLVHVDDATVDQIRDVSKVRYLYIFDDEEKRGELREAIDDFRQQYILVSGIVFPSWLRGELDSLDDDVITAIAWMMALGTKPEPEHLDVIREHI